MKAMVLSELCNLEENKTPLRLADLPDPVPGEKDILVKVSACGVCHTELDEIEGRAPPPHLPARQTLARSRRGAGTRMHPRGRCAP